MSKFPMITKWLPGLSVWNDMAWADRDGEGFNAHAILADDLERELAKCSLAIGENDNWFTQRTASASRCVHPRTLTHEALLLGPHPIKQPRRREVSESQVREALSLFAKTEMTFEETINRLFGESEG